ncbi:MAG: glutathione peroxidase [Aridibacter sp.]
MQKILSFFVVAIIATVILSVYGINMLSSSASNMKTEVTAKSIYEFKVTDIDGKEIKLKKYKNKVVMFVNTASKCGYTPQYEGLQKIYDKYKDQGFVILGFPANNFGGQEPGSNEEIKEFCTLKYKVSFPMFAKISVKGDDQHPLYQYLTSEKTDPKFAGEITWNFNKFLVNEKGEIIARFSSKETPESKEVTNAIENALDKMSEK